MGLTGLSLPGTEATPGRSSHMMIEAKGIEKSFGTLKVLKGIDFSVDKSEVVSIMGASGAGKSTLLHILGTLSSPDSGTLTIDGTDVLNLASKALSSFRNRKIGFVFQFHHLLPEFTSLENVMIPALIAGRSARDAKKTAEGLLEDLGLSERMSHKPSELSGGEQQELHGLFFSLRDRYGQTIVIVTHDPELASMCDRTLVMKDGLFVPASDGRGTGEQEPAGEEE